MSKVPTIVLGGTGYVAGELLRLLSQHPSLKLAAAVSTSRAGKAISGAFRHLGPAYPKQRFLSPEEAIRGLRKAPNWTVISAAPHGASASLVNEILGEAESSGTKVSVVDASADFRFSDPKIFEQIYEQDHPAPQHLTQFSCAVPEHLKDIKTPHAAQPGCFATAMLLGIVPLVSMGVTDNNFFVSAVTGSTGAGSGLRETTHHPVRHSNLFAYQPLVHRHDPEVKELVTAATGEKIDLNFVPHSGPFARGIHSTIFAQCKEKVTGKQLTEALSDFYADCGLVWVGPNPPYLKDVAGSNCAFLSVNAENNTVAVCCVLDNLLKGAASGAIQWANRLSGKPDDEGLKNAPPGWI